jgi:phosphoglycolate phosphatase
VAKAALFDLDGTLIDSNDAIVWCVNELMRNLSLPPAKPDEIIKLIGVGLTPLLRQFIPEPEAHIEEYRRLYRQGFAEKTKVYKGAAELLNGLREEGLKTGIVTNRNQELALDIVSHFGMDKLVDVLIGEGDGLPLKPDPAVVFEACRRVKVDAKDTLMIGDTEIDIVTGKNAGCRTVLVNHNGETRRFGEDYAVASLAEITSLIYRS